MPEVAIVAALQREIAPLVRGWQRVEREHAGRRFEFYESAGAVLVCGGIGPEAARRATEAAIAIYHPVELVSVGFAGALEARLRVGELVKPAAVIDARDGSRIQTDRGSGVLVSFGSVASEEQKTKLARAYGAQAVDMEAASVAKGAQAHGLRYRAVKVISDELGFAMPPMEGFITSDGHFRGTRFALYTAIRPWWWAQVLRLGRNSARAARALSEDFASGVADISSLTERAKETAVRKS